MDSSDGVGGRCDGSRRGVRGDGVGGEWVVDVREDDGVAGDMEGAENGCAGGSGRHFGALPALTVGYGRSGEG